METFFLQKHLEDVNRRFLGFQQMVNVFNDVNFFFLSKVLFDYKNQKWQATLNKNENSYKICIPCTSDFSLYKDIRESNFKYIKDVLMFVLDFKSDDKEERKLTIYTSKNNLYVVSLSRSFRMEIKFFNGEPMRDHEFYTKQDIMKLVQQRD